GAFPNGTSMTVPTDVNGYAVPPLLVANSTPGSFTVTATDDTPPPGTPGTVTFNVTTSPCQTDPGVSMSGDSGIGTLRDAVNKACAGSTITFQSGVSSTITLASRLRIDDDLTIQGPGAGSLAIDGNNATRLLFIGGGNVKISGLTLKNGLGNGWDAGCGGGSAGMGGALYQNNGFVTLSDVTLSDNKAQGGN